MNRADTLRIMVDAGLLGRLDKAAGLLAGSENPDEIAFLAKFRALQNALFGRVMDRTPEALVAACDAFGTAEVDALRRYGLHEAADDLVMLRGRND